jgi:hypothetical protein
MGFFTRSSCIRAWAGDSPISVEHAETAICLSELKPNACADEATRERVRCGSSSSSTPLPSL